MDLVVCPRDAEPLKVMQRRPVGSARPLLACPRCERRFVLSAGGLEEVRSP